MLMEFVIFMAFSIQFSAPENPSMHPVYSLGEGKRVTWQMQKTLTETERLVLAVSEMSCVRSTGLEGSACEPDTGISLSSGRGMGDGGLKSNFSTTRFLVARSPRRTLETTANDREDGISSGGLLRLPVRVLDFVMMRKEGQVERRRSVDDGASWALQTGYLDIITQ